MILTAIFGAWMTAVGFVIGTGLHELSHVASVIGTGGTVERVEWGQTTVHYEPSNEWTDNLIKSTPTLLTPLLIATVIFSVSTVWGVMFAFGLIGGFIPRDPTEYVSLTQL